MFSSGAVHRTLWHCESELKGTNHPVHITLTSPHPVTQVCGVLASCSEVNQGCWHHSVMSEGLQDLTIQQSISSNPFLVLSFFCKLVVPKRISCHPILSRVTCTHTAMKGVQWCIDFHMTVSAIFSVMCLSHVSSSI